MNNPIEMRMGSGPHLRDSLARVRPEMAALSSSELLQINVDPWWAVAVVRAALPTLESLRPQLALLSPFHLESLDSLEDYALALLQVESEYQGIASMPHERPLLLKEGVVLRKRLIVDARALAQRELVSEAVLARLNAPKGYRAVGTDLLTLAALLRGSWQQVLGHTAIQPAEVERAELLGELLNGVATLRMHSVDAAADVIDDRLRAFTLLVRAYREVRRAVRYLRGREGDADRFAPSIYQRRGVSRKSEVVGTATNQPAALPESAPGNEQELEGSQSTAAQETKTPVVDPFIH